MKTARIPLKPFSRFHFGEFKYDMNVALSSTSFFAHSDILFSSLINSFAGLNGDATEFVNSFVNNKINISSLFYYLKKDKQVIHLLPVPVFIDKISKSDGLHKKRGRVQFVSKGVWESGFDTTGWFDQEKYTLIQDGEVLLTTQECRNLGLNEDSVLYSMVDLPKNPIRKASEDDSIYYQADVEISKIDGVESGFYYLYTAEGNDEIMLKNATNVMAFSGIGGERSNTGRTMGAPVFEIEFNMDFQPGSISYENGFTNISLLNPQQEELKHVIYSKTILRGGGRKDDDTSFSVVRMITEGSLLESSDVTGRLVKTGTDFNNNDVLRNGKSFVLPIRYNKVNNELQTF